MALHIRSAIRDGLARVITRNGMVLMGLYLLATVFQMGLIYIVGSTYVPPSPETAGAPATGSAPPAGSSLPPVVSAVASSLGSLTGGLLTLPITIIGVRTFVSDRTDAIPDEFVFHRLGRATLSAFVAGLVVFLLYFLVSIVPFIVGVGALFVVQDVTVSWLVTTWPGRAVGFVALLVFVAPAAFLMVSLLFVNQEIAVRDRGVVGAIRGSWAVARGNRLGILGLYLALLAFQLAVIVPLSTLVPESAQPVSSLASVPLALLSMSILARAYVQLVDDARDSLPRPAEKP